MSSACPCGGAQCPQAVTNVPGLRQISYRAADFSQIREALLRPLGGEVSLLGWQPAAGDLGLQVLEWWAYLGDILTFYNERIANEDYLRTATMAQNLAGLVDLIGYQPRPAVAATGQLAAVRSASHPNEPLVIPQGMALSSSATAGVPAQNFVVSSTQTFPPTGPAQVQVMPYPNPTLLPNDAGNGPASVLLQGKASGLNVGDFVLLVESGWAGADDGWCWTTIASLTPVVDPNTGGTNTVVAFDPLAGWGPSGTSTPTYSESTQFELMKPLQSTTLWTRDVPKDDSIIEVSCLPVVHLNDVVRALLPGQLLLFDGLDSARSALTVAAECQEETWYLPAQGQPSTQTLTVTAGSGSSATTSTESSTTSASIAYPHTAVTILTQDRSTITGYSNLSEVPLRFGFKSVGTVVPVPQSQISSLPADVAAPASFTPPSTTQTAMLVDSTGAGILVGVCASSDPDPAPAPWTTGLTLNPLGASRQTISTVLQAPFTLYFDLLPVTRGTLVASETLGSGDATQINQSFTLKNGPLTYLSEGATVQAVLRVYVNGLEWTQVRSFYQQSQVATVYVVSLDTQGNATITFGDGVSGARLPTGTGNVTASYSYGAGAASPPAGRLTTILKPQPNLAAVQNPIAVSGGADAQSAGDVKQNAPASVFTFGRAISALDYQVIAAQAAGVSQAQSVWSFNTQTQRTTVTIYVAGTEPTAASSTAAQAAAQAALAGAEDPNRPVTVLPATALPLTVSATLIVADNRVLSAVFAEAIAVLTDPVNGPFGPSSCPIGSRFYRSALDKALMVPGVSAVQELTAIRRGSLLPRRGQPHWLELGDYLDPGQGAYFALGDYSGVTAVYASAAAVASDTSSATL